VKRVAIIYERPLDTGGVEAHLLSLFRYIDRHRYKFIIFSPMTASYQEKVLALDVKVQIIPPYGPLSLSTVFRLNGLFRQEKIDLVHIHSPIAAVPGRLAARLCGIPDVVTVHLPAERYYGNLPTPRARIGRWLYTHIDRLLNVMLTNRMIYVSRHAYHEALKHQRVLAERSVVIPNGIDLVKFREPGFGIHPREQYSVSDETLVLTFVGRLDEQKGVDVLLQSLAQLMLQNEMKIQLWIIGDGPKEVELRSLCQKFGLAGIVQFIGRQEVVVSFLQASDIFILPSRYEGMSIALLEALAAGLPCIVTDVGDNSLVVSDGIQGKVVPPDQPQALAQAIRALVEDRSLLQQMGTQARESAVAYGVERMSRQVEKLYGQLT
jgi:glycosyltransferase involved in cell wall biosynthesis